jgi:hypothetical protein
MFQPQTLTPDERDAFLKKLGLDQKPYDSIFRTLTNPLLIASLALAHKFPIPVGGNVFKLSERVGSLTSRFPIMGKMASMQALFRGTKVPDDLSKIIHDMHDFRSRYGGELGTVLGKFQAKTGRLPDPREQVMVASWLDGLHKKVRGFGGREGVVRVGSGEGTKVLPGVKALMPGLEGKMGRPLLELAQDLRGVLDRQWMETFGDIQGRKRILQALARQKKAGFSDEISESMEAFLQNPKKIPDYFPRRMMQTDEDFRKIIQRMTDQASAKRYAKSASRKATQWASPEVMKRKYATVPNSEELDLVADLVDPKMRANLDAIVKARVLHKARVAGMNSRTVQRMEGLKLKEIEEVYPKIMGEEEARKFVEVLADHRPRSYSLRMMPVLADYNHTLAGTFAWTVKGGGEKMIKSLDDLKALGRAGNVPAKARAEMLENTYIPIAMGRGTFRQAIRAQMWEHSNLEMAAWLGANPQAKSLLGPELTQRLVDGLRTSRGAFSMLNLQRKAAGYFYLSTLGLNPGSALKNTLQLVLTTGPAIGYRTAAAGVERAFRKSHKYFALRLGPRKLSHDAALRKAYPDFAEAGLVAAPITDEVVQNTLQNSYNIAALPSGAEKVADKIKRAMMAMFTASETTVRVASFEAGMLHAKRAGMGTDAAIAFSRKLVEQTQFLTGPVNTPFMLLDKSPLVRQLTQFPLRFLEFVTSNALTMGSGLVDPRTGKEMNILGRNPGTLARMLAGSIIAMEVGDAMGVNMGDALVGGALPTFQKKGPFAPFPIVPPFFQVLGAAGIGATSGDFTELLQSTPLLVPGGVEFSRMSGLLPPGVPGSQMGAAAARMLDRPTADYNNPAPDGRIPVYTGKGKLKGYYTGWELVKYGMGVRGGDMGKEQELLNLLMSQRTQIREERVQYLDARFRNDPAKANQVATNFKQRFGFELPVSEKDVRAMQLRRRVTRLEQVVRTLPPGEARDRMVQVIAATLGTEGETILGIDPLLLGATGPEREAARTRVGPSRPAFQARTDLGPMDRVNPATIGRQQGTRTAQPPL